MVSVPKLAAQLDRALSGVPPAVEEVPPALRKLAEHLTSSTGRQEFSDIVLEIIPSLVAAAHISSDTINTAACGLLVSAAECCAAPREVFVATAAALSDTLNYQERGGKDPAPLLLRSLLEALRVCLVRIDRKWVNFLEDYLALAVRRYRVSLMDTAPLQFQSTATDDFIVAWKEASSCLDINQGNISDAEAECAERTLYRAAFQAVMMAVESPSQLEAAQRCLAQVLPTAKSTPSGRLLRLKPVVSRVLEDSRRLLGCIKKRLTERGGINQLNFEKTFPTDYNGYDDEDTACAVTTCCAALTPPAGAADPTGLDPVIVFPLFTSCIATRLRRLSIAVRHFTDIAAHREHVPLALVPLMAVQQTALQLNAAGSSLDDGNIELAHPIMEIVVRVMSYSPAEILRTAAYEAQNALLDAMAPSARLLSLRQMLLMPSNAAAVVALQRMRREISNAVIPLPFTRTIALEAARPWLQQGDTPPNWNTVTRFMENADVIAASLSIYRFIILLDLAHTAGSISGDNGAISATERLPFLLQQEQLENEIESVLKPLQSCTDLILRQRDASIILNGDDGDAKGALLAVSRVHEVVERTVQAATQLMSFHRERLKMHHSD